MKAEIITIGDEILIGHTTDTNSAWMANKLNLIGVDIIRITSISDKKEEVIKAIDNVSENADVVLMTGGLGPTNDDITKESLADYFGVKLVLNEAVLRHIEQFVIKRKAFMNDRNIKQAYLPENCEIIHNKIGTAAGMLFHMNNKILISMPGVPYEMKEMITSEIIPLLSKQQKGNEIIHKAILTQGAPESKLAELLEDWESNIPKHISLAYLPSPGIVKLRLTARGSKKALLNEQINKQVQELQALIPNLICGFDADRLEEIVGNLLKAKKMTLSTAESCTGGTIAKLITSIPGSSEYFTGGIVAYTNNIKSKILAVSKRNIEDYGAVSKQVVEEMAVRVRDLYKSNYSVATSGIAGPSGGTKDKPVGTTWIAVANESTVISKKFILGDQRERNIQRASVTALNMLQKLLLNKEI